MNTLPPPTAEDDLILIEEDGTALPPMTVGDRPWKILIVDDDPDVHQSSDLALRGISIEHRPLALLHAYSGAEARTLVAEHEDIAVILLDVVMETEESGLDLVRHLRGVLGRSALRIILRTGQPGYAPELETIRNYDINDYKTKSELTRVRLFTSLTTAVRAYRQICMHEEMRRGLELIVQASTELTRLHGMQLLAQGVVSQICALLNIEQDGLICAQAGLKDESEPTRVIAAAGNFSHLVHRPLAELDLPDVQEALETCLRTRQSHFGANLALYFGAEEGRGLAAFINVKRDLRDIDCHLLKVFCTSMAVGFENVLLYGRLVVQAYVDPLLNIPNLNRLLELLTAPQATDLATLALLDINDFSAINDTLGHDFGDAVLHAVAVRLSENLPLCTIARLGSDVFGILGPADRVEPGRLKHVFETPFMALGQQVRLDATMGLVRLDERPRASRSGPGLLKDAHLALKQAKQHQRGSVVYFSETMGQDARERMRLLGELRTAFETQHFFLVYQPKVRLSDGHPSGVEALLRWRTAEGDLVPPDRFIPIAEQSGLMIALGTFVLRSACRQLVRLRAAGYQHLTMAINVSRAQLLDPDFLTVLGQALTDTKAPAETIELEITESMAAEDLERLRHLLGEIRAFGINIAIDDFGTGFSSLSVLRHLNAGRLKIDQSFIREMDSDDSIARMVISLGHSQGMSVTAEGVETEAQRQALCDLGCDEGQGWLFSRPLDEDALLAWLGPSA